MTLIDRYLIRTVLTYTALVMAALLVLGGLFTFIDQQDDSDVGRYGTGDALVFTLLSIPQQAYELMPIGALLGALLGMGMLAGNSELTAIRASGMSVVRIATAIALGGMTITLLTVALGEFIAPTLQNIAYQQKALRKFSHVSLLGAGGAWIKEGNTIINVDERSGAEWYGGINIFRLKSPGELASMAIAERAFAEKRSWHLDHYSETRFGGNQISSEHVASTNLHMLVDSGILGGAQSSPRQLPSSRLWQLIHYFRLNGIDAKKYQFALWSRIARTCSITVLTLLAVPFSFGSLRSSGSGARLMSGILLGLAFFFLQKLMESGAVVFDESPIVLAWIPTGIITAITLIWVLRTR